MKRIAILGATGSVGESTLDVIARNPDQFELVAVTARRQVKKLVEICRRFRPRFAAIADESSGESLSAAVADLDVEVGVGAEGLRRAAEWPAADAVMAAIVGGAGLEPTLAAADAGKQVLLANKEALVMSGELFMQACRRSGAVLLPIDSEHNAIYQCLPADARLGKAPAGVAKLILTASGGPFLTWSAAEMATATPDQACAHPRWTMGRKISVDSATLMNKGLELIEAHWLFGLPLAQIEIVIHPQSVIHSLVAYRDGSMLAQLGAPDMRVPIAHALAWPARVDSGVGLLNLAESEALSFAPPDSEQFPALRLARAAAQAGPACTIGLNAANEIAVQRFLNGELKFGQIMKLVEDVVDQTEQTEVTSVQEVLNCDQTARGIARRWTAGARLTA